MALDDLKIRLEYRSLIQNVARDFLIPSLRQAISYDRAVGFFSSSSLADISYGIEGLALNGGKIRLIASPKLSEEDAEAIRQGYADREKMVEMALNSALNEPSNHFEKEKLNLLANLIKDNVLEIRIAFLENKSDIGIYHEKLGIIKDLNNNIISFSGSMNESDTAFNVNYEAIDVFCSWKSDDQRERIQYKLNAFESIWNNTEPGIYVMDFPDTVKENLLQIYYKEKVDYENIPMPEHIDDTEKAAIDYPGAKIPEGFKFHDYQKEAIQEWVKQGYRGIFDMATGTGKTYTGLGAISALNAHLKGHLAVIIVCPYQHLVEQWVEDIELFGMHPIIGYSASKQKDWKQRLDKAIRYQKIGTKGHEFFCFICTNASFARESVQDIVAKIKVNKLLVVDEAHNFGSRTLKATLNDTYDYRLALSATLERHHDEEGTQDLYDFFGEKCIEYTLERAIDEKKLTRYKYYPVIVELTDDELVQYYAYTKKIGQCMKVDKHGKKTLNELGKRLCLARARLVAAAKNKIEALEDVIKPYTRQSHMLVYCGAASLRDYGDDDYFDENELRQIDAVSDLLGNKLNMRISQYTSRENMDQRRIIKEEFAAGDGLQALVAIKCLDEGVNIPSIKMAFILASTTNPKEYIQRRGRVLRLFPGKEYAVIYDFITLPKSLHDSYYNTESEQKMSHTLARNECARAFEFARLADNFLEANKVIDKIRSAYNIQETTFVTEEEEFDEYN